MTGSSWLGPVLSEALGVAAPLDWIVLVLGIPLVIGLLAIRDRRRGLPRREASIVWHRGPSWEGIVPQAAPAHVGDYVVCLSCGLMARREPGAILPEGWAWSLWRIGEARTFRYACSTPCTRILL